MKFLPFVCPTLTQQYTRILILTRKIPPVETIIHLIEYNISKILPLQLSIESIRKDYYLPRHLPSIPRYYGFTFAFSARKFSSDRTLFSAFPPPLPAIITGIQDSRKSLVLSLFSFSVSLSFRGGSFGGIGWIKGGKQCCGRHRFAAAVLTTHFRASSFRGMYFLQRYLQPFVLLLPRRVSATVSGLSMRRGMWRRRGCLIAFLTLLILCVICCCGTNTFFFSKNKYVSLIRVDVVIF